MAPHIPGISPESAGLNEALKAEALRKILGVGLTTAGIGAGAAGLLHLFKKMTKPKGPTYSVPEDVDLPYPQLQEKKSAMTPMMAESLSALRNTVGALGTSGALSGVDEGGSPVIGAMRGAARQMPHVPLTTLGSIIGSSGADRLAESAMGTNPKAKAVRSVARLMGMIGGGTGGYMTSKPTVKEIHKLVKESDWAEKIVHAIMPTGGGDSSPSVFSPAWLRGDTQKTVSGIPWAIPGGMLAGLGGLAGGGALVNWLMKKRRKAKGKDELEKAQQEYESAMLAQYEPEKLHKISSATATLDQIATAAEKRAFNLNDILGKGTGAYLTLASLLAGGAGLGTYRYLKGRSKDELLEKALKQRAMVRSLEHPPDIYIHPISRPMKATRGMADELVTEESRPSL